jgi:2-keto-4-pentenoate hydratase/2-oxohepta-3-ene-1,7-dioic acid hydratase in catechol pathway
MKIICIGRNYVKHIEELGNDCPDEPVVFLKPDSSILLKQHPFVIPEFTDDVHHEVELLVKINKVGKYIEPKFASNYYDEIGLGIDFTARDLQAKLKEKGLPWEKAKSFDGAAVIGDFYAKSDYKSLDNIEFKLVKNGEIVQLGTTSHMIWKIDELIAHVSQFFTLKKGDVIFTGTPEGVAAVKPNDILEGYLEDKKSFRIQVK